MPGNFCTGRGARKLFSFAKAISNCPFGLISSVATLLISLLLASP
jgi:hypothetical protein